MPLPTVDLDETVTALRATARRFGGAARTTRDAAAPAVGTWTVRDVVAHVASLTGVYERLLAGEPSPITNLATMSEHLGVLKDDVGERDLGALADRAEAGLIRLADRIAGLAPEDERPWHGRLSLPVASHAAVLLAEALVHGWDVAHAGHERWPIDAGAARQVSAGLLPVLPHYLDDEAAEGVDATIEIRLRGGRDPIRLRVDGGALTVHAAGSGPVDCTLSADPATFLLVSFGRRGPLVPALTGRIVAWGRRPWLAFGLTRWLRRP